MANHNCKLATDMTKMFLNLMTILKCSIIMLSIWKVFFIHTNILMYTYSVTNISTNCCRCLCVCLWMRTWTELYPSPNNQRTRYKLYWKLVTDSFRSSMRGPGRESVHISNLVGAWEDQRILVDGNRYSIIGYFNSVIWKNSLNTFKNSMLMVY